MGGRIAKWVGAVLVLAVLGLAGYALWPKPPFPVTPVPMLDLRQADFLARLQPPQPDLQPLTAQVTGRSAAGPVPGSHRHEWPGFHASARFQGGAVTLRFDDAVNRWRVTLDGQAILVSRPGRQDLHITGLDAGPHQIRAEKISESAAPALFGGFFVESAAQALPPPEPEARLVEFIGDSDTLGLADTAQRRDCSAEQVFAATDTSRAFAPQVAQALGADYRVIARSGIGLLRNYGGAEPGQEMPRLYPLALPRDPEALALPQRPADILAIGLGSNDFGSDFAKGEPWADKAALSADFGPALADFARARMQENPGARLVLLAFGEYGAELTDAYRAASARLAAAGLASKTVVLPEPRRNACLWHPSQSDHQAMAKLLSEALLAPD